MRQVIKWDPVNYLLLGFVTFYILGYWFPDYWWGTHAMAFLDPQWAITFGILILIIIFLGPGYFEKQSQNEKFSGTWKLRLGQRILITGSMALVFGLFPIAGDEYGDAGRFLEAMGERTTEITPNHIKYFLTPNILSSKNGERTLLNGIQLCSYYTDWSHERIFKGLSIIFGALFIWIWLWFLQRLKLPYLAGVIGLFLGILSPFTWNFYGHIEIYAPIFATMTLYLALFTFSLERNNKWDLLWLVILFFICLKLHAASFLLAPVLGVRMIMYYSKNDRIQGIFSSWNNAVLYVLGPVIIAGIVLYFFITGDYKDLRYFSQDVTIGERLFLPLYGPTPPLDRYTLLHENHFSDFFNLQFLWSPAALFLIICVIIWRRKSIRWQNPKIIAIGLYLIILILFFFMVNPLLGMQFDADLFTIPVPVLLVFTMILLKHEEKENRFNLRLLPGVLVLSLLTIPHIAANASRTALSYRYESLGSGKFKTYWIHSSAEINYGLRMVRNDPDQYIERYDSVINKLKPFALPGNDLEYADIIWRAGKAYKEARSDRKKAIYYFEKSIYYYPDLKANRVSLMEAYFLENQFDKAYAQSLELIRLTYPDEQSALRMAIHTALEAGFYENAQNHCQDYLRKWPDDELISLIATRLNNNEDIEQLKFLFARSRNG